MLEFYLFDIMNYKGEFTKILINKITNQANTFDI